MNLRYYVKRRNFVSLGSGDSLHNMLSRSPGADTFSKFWQYWNPIWGYYLGKYIYKPLKLILLSSISLVITFIACGFIHDLVITLLK